MFRILICAFFAVVFSCASFAGSYQGTVKSVFAYNGKIYVLMREGHYDNANTCTGNANQFHAWVDPSTEFGKALISIALAAKVSGKVVWAAGNNSCSAGALGLAEHLIALDLKG